VAKRVRDGWRAHLLIVATGVSGRYDKPEAAADQIATAVYALREDVAKAAGLIGFSSWECLDFPDNRLDSISRMELSHAIRPFIERLKPHVVFTHHPGDYNWDHGRVFDAVMMAGRHDAGAFAPEEIYTCEVPSSTERAWQTPEAAFCPNVFVGVAETLAVKQEALAAYRSESRPYPHPRSPDAIEHLARFRGCAVGATHAEAFCLIRRVEE
jgi:LmbE family N-acetylglucosaminyl deacetylase